MVSLVQGEGTTVERGANRKQPHRCSQFLHVERAEKVSQVNFSFFFDCIACRKTEQDMTGREHELTLAPVKHTRNVNEYELYLENRLKKKIIIHFFHLNYGILSYSFHLFSEIISIKM